MALTDDDRSAASTQPLEFASTLPGPGAWQVDAIAAPAAPPVKPTLLQRLGLEQHITRPMRWALLLSLVVHAGLLGVNLSGQGLGLPGLNLPWQARRAEVPDLQVRLNDVPPPRTTPAPLPPALPAALRPPAKDLTPKRPVRAADEPRVLSIHATPPPEPERPATEVRTLAKKPAAPPRSSPQAPAPYPKSTTIKIPALPPASKPLTAIKGVVTRELSEALIRSDIAAAPTEPVLPRTAAPLAAPRPVALSASSALPLSKRNDKQAQAEAARQAEQALEALRAQRQAELRAAEQEALRQAQARQEAQRAEQQARTEAAQRQEAVRLEAERQEAARAAAAREAQARQDQAQREIAQREAARAEAARLEAAQAATRQEAARREEARHEVQRQEAARQEAARAEAERREAARIEAARVEAARLEAERLEGARREAVRAEATRQEAARQEVTRLEAARAEATRAEAARAEAARLEAARVEAAHVAAAKQEAARIEAARQAQLQAEAARQEALLQEAARQEAARLQAQRDAEARREALKQEIGKQLDEAAARRDAQAAAARTQPASVGPSASSQRRGRLFGRADRNAELVLYAETWARKIQLNTTFERMRSITSKPHTQPIVTVALRSDGSVEGVSFVRSSGVAAIDELVRNVIQEQGPYQPFAPNLAREFDVIEIQRHWHFDTVIRLY